MVLTLGDIDWVVFFFRSTIGIIIAVGIEKIVRGHIKIVGEHTKIVI